MAIDQIDTVVDEPTDIRPATKRRAAVYAYLAAVWSLVYAGLAVGWAVGIPGWPAPPFERAGTDMPPALASGLPPSLLAGLAMATAGVAIAIANGWGRSAVRTALLSTAWVVAGGLALAFTTERLLPLIGYAPIYLLGAPFDWPPGSWFDHVTWPIVHEAICLLGGALWALTAVWYRRRTAPRGAAIAGHGQVTRRDRWAVGVAVAMPLLYASTRYAWLLGVPLGISEEFLRAGQRTGLWVAGAGLATFAVVGALLTLGLVQRWGEMLPRWVPVVGGRRVPPALATAPAAAVSVLLITAGLGLLRDAVAAPVPWNPGMWAASQPMLTVFPVWGVALATATLGYHRRRSARRQR
ncbi:MAG TPA: hypothetical protein VK891_12260 [Euzebyales bacterium]|nr:hypothetical protein [Euzebyales bacterium]